MQYRPEIDGLRSLAILPVILFHAGFGMKGGFLGVDVFLVISGYLITSIILKEQARQQFSLVFFYERRARRILPALFFVLTVSSVVASFVLNPLMLEDFAHSVLATLGFSANIYFWQHIDYFTGNTDLLPLLHLWSLGIEEQFYFIFPLLLMAVAAWQGQHPQRRLWLVLISLFLLSLGIAQWLSSERSPAAFYLLPSRAWELLAGAGCAVYLNQQSTRISSPLTAQLGSALGLVLLLLSMLIFRSKTPHPGLYTLIPVMATVLIILYAKPHTYVARFLSLRPLVWIGLLSYSAYLWHQPLFAFARYLKQQPQLSVKLSAALILLTFALSAFSWRFVEQPFRNRAFLSTKRIFQLSAGGMVVGALTMLFILHQDGFIHRYPPHQQMLLSHHRVMRDFAKIEDPCFLSEVEDSRVLGEHCKLNPEQPVAIMGDSHSAALWLGLKNQQPTAKYSASGCAPLLGDETAHWRPHCPSINAFNFEEVAQKQPQKLFLHANWLMYLDEMIKKEPGIVGLRLEQTLAHLQSIAPQTQLIVVGGVPQWQPSLIDVLNSYPEGEPLNVDIYQPNSSYPQLKQLDDEMQAVSQKAGVDYISFIDTLCREDGQCRALVVPTEEHDWLPTMWDYGHLTEAGAGYLTELLFEQLRAAEPSHTPHAAK